MEAIAGHIGGSVHRNPNATKKGDEACERERKLETRRLRERGARFVREHDAQIASAAPVLPDALNDRAADIWEPLLVLAEIAGGDWPEKARAAALGLSAQAQEANPIGSLLFDIFMVFTMNKAKKLLTRDLIAGLNSFENRPMGAHAGIVASTHQASTETKWFRGIGARTS